MDSIYIKFHPISINSPPVLLHVSDIQPIICNLTPGLQESPMRTPMSGARCLMSANTRGPALAELPKMPQSRSRSGISPSRELTLAGIISQKHLLKVSLLNDCWLMLIFCCDFFYNHLMVTKWNVCIISSLLIDHKFKGYFRINSVSKCGKQHDQQTITPNCDVNNRRKNRS